MNAIYHLRNFAVAWPFIAAAALSAAPTPRAANPPPPAPKSVFVMPQEPKEGRDPFFPNSSRPYETANVKNVDNTVLHTLKIKSIMDGGDGRVFAIINNHTFAPGDEGTVINDQGQRINIQCLEINSKAGTVTVESAGARATLNFSDKP